MVQFTRILTWNPSRLCRDFRLEGPINISCLCRDSRLEESINISYLCRDSRLETLLIYAKILNLKIQPRLLIYVEILDLKANHHFPYVQRLQTWNSIILSWLCKDSRHESQSLFPICVKTPGVEFNYPFLSM